ncbi:MAG: virulence RhuM family protein [Clostridia bacterium]|nr:virulence RhuM family protein [Clostridia bacterium]
MNKELEFLLYNTPQDDVEINVMIDKETVWLTQAQMSELFQRDRTVITKHIKNIFDEGELEEQSNVQNLHIPNSDKKVAFYSLDVIISVGYRVKSLRGTQFRIWATAVLKEYIRKGFVLDDERLKQGQTAFDKDYFQELLERVRSIRASERRVWQKITDIFAECSTDYDKRSPVTKDFYATVQNKFHYAITGQTAAEIIYSKADSEKHNMGLTTWKNAPDGRVLKSDVTVAKNYLSEVEIRRLERTVSGFFDYIEDLVERGHTFTMEDFSKSINRFLAFREYKILGNKGSISREEADQKAFAEYDKFNKTQKIVSDFDKEIRRLKEKHDTRED